MATVLTGNSGFAALSGLGQVGLDAQALMSAGQAVQYAKALSGVVGDVFVHDDDSVALTFALAGGGSVAQSTKRSLAMKFTAVDDGSVGSVNGGTVNKSDLLNFEVGQFRQEHMPYLISLALEEADDQFAAKLSAIAFWRADLMTIAIDGMTLVASTAKKIQTVPDKLSTTAIMASIRESVGTDELIDAALSGLIAASFVNPRAAESLDRFICTHHTHLLKPSHMWAIRGKGGVSLVTHDSLENLRQRRPKLFIDDAVADANFPDPEITALVNESLTNWDKAQSLALLAHDSPSRFSVAHLPGMIAAAKTHGLVATNALVALALKSERLKHLALASLFAVAETSRDLMGFRNIAVESPELKDAVIFGLTNLAEKKEAEALELKLLKRSHPEYFNKKG